MTTWTCHYEANGFMWWTLEGTDWVVERVRRDDGRYVYECRLGRVAQLAVIRSVRSQHWRVCRIRRSRMW
jgi:hypothetical protein